MIRAIAGRISGIPLKLSLLPLTVTSVARGGKVTIHVLQFDLAQSITPMQLAAAGRSRQIGILPLPDESGELPADAEPVVEEEVMGDPAKAPVQEFSSKRDIKQEETPPTQEPRPRVAPNPSRDIDPPKTTRRDCVLHPGKMLGKTPKGEMGHPIGNGAFCYGDTSVTIVPPSTPATIVPRPSPTMTMISDQPLPNLAAPSGILPAAIDHNEAHDFDKRNEDILSQEAERTATTATLEAPEVLVDEILDDVPEGEIALQAAPKTPRKRSTPGKLADDDNRVLVIKDAAKRLSFSDFEMDMILGGGIDVYLNRGKNAVMAVQEMEEFAVRRKANAAKAAQQEAQREENT